VIVVWSVELKGFMPRPFFALKRLVGHESDWFPCIEHRILDSIQGHSSGNVAEGYGEVTIRTQAAAIAKLPRYEI